MSNTTLSSATALVPTFDGIINGERQLLVNARELHVFLESRQDFSTWIAKRIGKYEFVENQDYIIVHENLAPQKNGAEKSMTYSNWQGKIDYHLTLDMAKELSMVERNAKGKQARQYFIACEKRLYALAVSGNADPLTAINANLQKMTDSITAMADGIATLAQASQVQLRQLDRTADYINLLELNQKGHIKVTPEVIEQVKLMKQGGYSQASIARMLRLSGATVSQIVHDKYPMNAITHDNNIARLVDTAKTVLAQKEQKGAMS